MPIAAIDQPTAAEQLLLELLNRARANPAGEFDALILDAATRTGATQDITIAINDQTRIGNTIYTGFDVDMAMLRSQLNALTSVAPLAWNPALAAGAEQHNALMITHDTQSHNLPGEASLSDRLQAAGYSGATRLAENIFAYTQSPLHGHAGFFIDWGYGPGGIQSPAGHRNTIMNGALTEVGIAMTAETSSSTSVGPFLVTQDFGTRSGYVAQLLGVVINDADNDDFYDIGEGMAGVTVTVTGIPGTFVTTTWTSGGYQIELPNGAYNVVFTGGGLATEVTRSVTVSGQNVRLAIEADDAGGGRTLIASGGDNLFEGSDGIDLVDYANAAGRVIADLGLDVRGQGFVRFFAAGAAAGDSYVAIENLRGGASADNLRGDGGVNWLYGGGVSDRLYGRGGDDHLFGGAGADALFGNRGADVMTGGDGAARDRFIFFAADESPAGAGNRDRITDFVSGRDRIEISRLDADSTQDGNQAFDFIGTDAFDLAGQLRYEATGGATLIQADIDGDGLADFEIELTGLMSLVASDFLL